MYIALVSNKQFVFGFCFVFHSYIVVFLKCYKRTYIFKTGNFKVNTLKQRKILYLKERLVEFRKKLVYNSLTKHLQKDWKTVVCVQVIGCLSPCQRVWRSPHEWVC